MKVAKKSTGTMRIVLAIMVPVLLSTHAFHGADVGREGRKINLDRVDLNGVKFIREIVAAGTAGGGYIEYHGDNPAVEGDEVNGSPKIGYAEGFRLPGKDQIFIVGSGIYATDR